MQFQLLGLTRDLQPLDNVNAEPYGIPVTYTGYALLFISLVWMLFDPKGGYRKLLKLSLIHI